MLHYKTINRDVRRSALSHLAISKISLPHILARTRDVKDEVRKHAIAILTEKIRMEHLTIQQRIFVLSECLNDRLVEICFFFFDGSDLDFFWVVSQKCDIGARKCAKIDSNVVGTT